MIELNYILDPAYRRETEEFDLHTATDTDLEFYVFCGDFYFRIDQANFDARWRWIPILGMARQFYDAALVMAHGHEPLPIWFSESSDEIRFTLTPDGMLEVTTTYSPGRAICSPVDMLDASRAFLTRVCKELSESYPRVLESESFAGTVRNVIGANRHFARSAMREFIENATPDTAKQLERALAPLVDLPDAASDLEELATQLARYRAEGDEELSRRDALIALVRRSLETSKGSAK